MNVIEAPTTTPPDELDLRVTNFYRVYGKKKNTKYAEKKMVVKQKNWYFSRHV